MIKVNCCIFNYGPHYRSAIYKLIDKEFNCDFFIGNQLFEPIKKMNYNILKGFKKELDFVPIFNNFYWQKNVVLLAFKPYRNYIITGDLRCLSTWAILFLNMLLGKKTFLWTHGFYGDESRLKIFAKKIYFSMCSKILLYGDYSKNLMITNGFKSNKLVSIYNSLNYDLQKSILSKAKKTKLFNNQFENNDPVLIYTGRIQRVKKIDLLIKSFNTLLKMNIKCNLVIVGDNSEDSDFLLNLVEDKSRVWFYGPCYDENKLCEMFYNSDVCISPGNVGLTAMHSLVYGTPVITHNNFQNQMPEFESITDGKTGSFFDENSLDSLIDKIKLWIGLNEKERNVVRNNCCKIIDERYNPHVQIEILKKLLNNR
jgi:glycosyltransferase involved in cell wall biosynthesis